MRGKESQSKAFKMRVETRKPGEPPGLLSNPESTVREGGASRPGKWKDLKDHRGREQCTCSEAPFWKSPPHPRHVSREGGSFGEVNL